MQEIDYTVHIFREGDTYVAHVPELDLSSCGATDEEARKNIRDAVHGFVETSRDMGTLAEILEEAGYVREGDAWRAPEFYVCTSNISRTFFTNVFGAKGF